MSCPTVGIDVDGVLGDYVKSFLELSRCYLGRPGPQVTYAANWNFEGQMPSEDVEFVWRKIKYSTNCTNWWMTHDKLLLTEDLTKASKLFNFIFITNRVSTRGLSPLEQTKKWLEEKYQLTEPRVIVVSGEKGPVAQELELEWFIDDKPSNCESVKDAVPTCNVFLQDQTYNQEFNRTDIPRIASLNEFLGLIR